jgi:hypothetical protein
MHRVPIVTLREFFRAVWHQEGFPPPWSRGREAMEELRRVHPEIEEAIRGTDCDPTDNDDRVPDFLWKVAELWPR